MRFDFDESLTPADLPILDEALLSELEEDVGMSNLYEILLEMVNALHGLADQLREAEIKLDMAALRDQAHAVKSAAATCGAMRLAQACDRLEFAALQNLSSDAQRLVDDCLTLTGETMIKLQATTMSLRRRMNPEGGDRIASYW